MNPWCRQNSRETNGKALEGDFAVDTALNASIVISGKFGQAHHLHFGRTKTIPAINIELGGVQQPVFARIMQVSLGPYEVRDPIAIFSAEIRRLRPSLISPDGWEPELLRRFTVTFDYPHQRLILDPNSDFRTDDLEDMSGLAIVATGSNLKTFEVTEVRSGTPGADAKIQKGDVIAGVDDEAAADLSLGSDSKIIPPAGHKIQTPDSAKRSSAYWSCSRLAAYSEPAIAFSGLTDSCRRIIRIAAKSWPCCSIGVPPSQTRYRDRIFRKYSVCRRGRR